MSYHATTGNQPVWDEWGNPIAAVNYTYYERDGIKDRSTRPLVISFNGGPGTASVWMQIAYTGPVLLNLDEEGNPVQPYGGGQQPLLHPRRGRYCLCEPCQYGLLPHIEQRG